MIAQCQKKWPHDDRTSFIISSAETYEPLHRFDLIVSSCSLQWFRDKPLAFQHIKQALLPGGSFTFAVPILGTFPELAQSFCAVTGRQTCPCTFFAATSYSSLLELAQFHVQHFEISDLIITAPNARFVIDSMIGIGAAPQELYDKNPLQPEQMKTLIDYYDTHFASTDGVTVSYRVLYGTVT